MYKEVLITNYFTQNTIIMNKIMSLVAVAVAMCMASCGNSVKETPLSDNLVKVSQTVENKNLNGVKTVDGKEIVPMEYTDVNLAEGYLIASNDRERYVYTLEGKRLLDKPASDVVFFDEYIKFYEEGLTNVYFKKNAKVVGPYKAVGTDSGFLFCEGDSVEAFNMDGNKVAGGKKVILLFSKPEAKYCFITVDATGEKATAYNTDGTELFPVDVKLLEKLPKASWKLSDNISQVNSRNELAAFKAGKAGKTAKKASKKRK